jgi:hypothetical protein
MRIALRALLRTPALTLAAILTIALGINIAVFTVFQQVLLDPLPFRDPGQLVHIAQTHPEYPSTQVSAPDFFDWQNSTTCWWRSCLSPPGARRRAPPGSRPHRC